MPRRRLLNLANLSGHLENVWGRAKFHYRLYPPLKKEEDLEANVIKALDSATIDEMRR